MLMGFYAPLRLSLPIVKENVSTKQISYHYTITCYVNALNDFILIFRLSAKVMEGGVIVLIILSPVLMLQVSFYSLRDQWLRYWWYNIIKKISVFSFTIEGASRLVFIWSITHYVQ